MYVINPSYLQPRVVHNAYLKCENGLSHFLKILPI